MNATQLDDQVETRRRCKLALCVVVPCRIVAQRVYVVTARLLYVRSGTTYYGVSLGRLPTLAHQVTGDVYVIDAKHFLIKNFVYDGTAPRAYLYARIPLVRFVNLRGSVVQPLLGYDKWYVELVHSKSATFFFAAVTLFPCRGAHAKLEITDRPLHFSKFLVNVNFDLVTNYVFKGSF